jgi:hypothetical protein
MRRILARGLLFASRFFAVYALVGGIIVFCGGIQWLSWYGASDADDKSGGSMLFAGVASFGVSWMLFVAAYALWSYAKVMAEFVFGRNVLAVRGTSRDAPA